MAGKQTSFGMRPLSMTVSTLGDTFRRSAMALRRQLWLWPLVAAVALAIGGWVVLRCVKIAIRSTVADELTTILNADVQALQLWMRQQETNAQILADAEGLQPLVQALLKEIEGSSKRLDLTLWQSPAVEKLRQYLDPRLRTLGYVDFVIVNPKYTIIAADQDMPMGQQLEGVRREFVRKVLDGNPSVSMPFRSTFLLEDETGQLRVGLPTMFAAAPIRRENHSIAVLGLRIRPEQEFTKILQVARAGESCETYAFDRNGLFLSQSRFDDDLKRLGLIADLPDSKSILTLSVRDPEGDITTGYRPKVERAKQPPTKMLAEAVTGKPGSDVDGYRDYRGVPVVGSWVWLTDYDFGVATEIDFAEAYQVLTLLNRVVWSLLAILILAAIAIFVFMIQAARNKLALQKAELAAKQLGQYKLEEKIGSGGMGSVFRARHAMLRRPTAVKLLEPEKLSELSVARFEREVQITAQLQHPNTIAIFDFGRTPEGLFYYVMEYLDGLNLDDLVTRYGPMPDGRVVALLQQICGSLAEAHEQGLVHRDVKPANIFLTQRGGLSDVVKVLDFGLARAVDTQAEGKVTSSGGVAGTPLYMAPEAIQTPDMVDHRSDIYSLGAVGYFLLTGRPVFEGQSLVELCMKQVKEVPVPPSEVIMHNISPALERLIMSCLAKQPHQRPGSTRQLIAELRSMEVVTPWTANDADHWSLMYHNKTLGQTIVGGNSETKINKPSENSPDLTAHYDGPPLGSGS